MADRNQATVTVGNPLSRKAAALSNLFEALAWLFTYPDREQAAEKTSREFLDLSEELASYAELDNPILQQMREVLVAETERDEHERSEQLRVEFTRLFVVPPPPINLEGSKWVTHRTEISRRTGERAAVGRLYRELGLRNQSDVNDPYDHLVSELDFASYLTAAESRAWEGGDAASARDWRLIRDEFIDDHLSDLAFGVAHDMEMKSESPFMRYYAALLESVISSCVDRV